MLCTEETMLTIGDKYREAIKRFRPEGDYAADVEADFRMIEPYLPEKVDSIIDIGCGLAGIDVYLKRKYPHAHLTLVDNDGEVASYGYSGRSGGYGSRELALEFLAEHGITVDEWLDADTARPLKADLVVSILAWGFHYPLSSYKVHGFCIADIRKKCEAPRGRVIMEGLKHFRCAFHSNGHIDFYGGRKVRRHIVKEDQKWRLR